MSIWPVETMHALPLSTVRKNQLVWLASHTYSLSLSCSCPPFKNYPNIWQQSFSFFLYSWFILCNKCWLQDLAMYANGTTKLWEAKSGQYHHLRGPLFLLSTGLPPILTFPLYSHRAPSLTIKWLLKSSILTLVVRWQLRGIATF